MSASLGPGDVLTMPASSSPEGARMKHTKLRSVVVLGAVVVLLLGGLTASGATAGVVVYCDDEIATTLGTKAMTPSSAQRAGT
jgi:hypothetical protein